MLCAPITKLFQLLYNAELASGSIGLYPKAVKMALEFVNQHKLIGINHLWFINIP